MSATLAAADRRARGPHVPLRRLLWWRFLEHAFWVAFEDAFLVVACLRGVREMRAMSERNAEIEALAEGAWRKGSVLDRAAAT